MNTIRLNSNQRNSFTLVPLHQEVHQEVQELGFNFARRIKSQYFIRSVFSMIFYKKYMNIIKYNKFIQNINNIGLLEYKKFDKGEPIEIEIIPTIGKFLNKEYITYLSCIIKLFDDKGEEMRDSREIEKYDDFKIEMESLSKIKITIAANYYNFNELFRECNGIKKIKIVSRNNKMINLERLFNKCTSLESVDLSLFDTSRVFYMGYMFAGCTSLKEVIIKPYYLFSLKNIRDMESMFRDCSSLEEIDFSYSKMVDYDLTVLDYMFKNCSSLAKVRMPKEIKNIPNSRKRGMFSGNCLFGRRLEEYIKKKEEELNAKK
jgi:surface protein